MAASFHWVKVNPPVLPVVMFVEVRLIDDGEHTAAGLIIVTLGIVLIVAVTTFLVADTQPVFIFLDSA